MISKFYTGLCRLMCLSSLIFIHTSTAEGQCDNPPNGESCLCSTAPILCTPDELDGFTFSMSSSTNIGNLAGDLCPGINSQDGVPNNVNFFAFIAWCENLTFDIAISNCVDYPGFPVSYGIQIALFANCGTQGGLDWDPVECLTEGDDTCYDSAADVPAIQTFATTGLTIGNTYYFMLDGCARSTCDITLDVVGVCGNGTIDPWTTDITGEVNACVDVPYTYTSEDLDGAIEFYYYIDGALIENGTEQTTFDHTWDTEGQYELCVDVSNLPCIDVDAMPEPNCITVNVFDPNAGDITVDPQPACPGEELSVTVSNYNTNPLLNLILYIVDENNEIQQVIDGDMAMVTYDQCAVWTAYSYNYITSDNPTLQTVGDTYTPHDCGPNCCDIVDMDLSWEDTDPPVFTTPPADLTVSCADDLVAATNLAYTDNCIDDGDVAPQETENFTPCDGGSILREWTVADSCNAEVVYTQTITIDPIPLAVWSSTPANMTVACIDKPTVFPDLVLTNSASSTCLIDETITPVVDDSGITTCGGDIILTWSYTDLCDRDYAISQTITVEPPAAPTLSETPASITIDCGEAIPAPIVITASNSSTGDCLLEEMLTAVVAEDTDICNRSVTYTWTYSDACGNMLNHSQTITVNPPPEATFNDLPDPVTLSCAEIPTTVTNLIADNGETGVCQIMETIIPTESGTPDECGGDITYTWSFIDDCGRPLTHTQVITIEPAPIGAFIGVPENITVDCGDPAGDPIDLAFTNNAMGTCLITEVVTPTVSGPPDPCGGNVVYTWTFTDDCGRPVTETQTITYNPAPEATWVTIPPTMDVDCEDFLDTPPMLSYNNNATGPCEISGSVPGVLVGTPGPCGESVMYQWTFTDDCGRPIQAEQIININEAPTPDFTSTPQDVTLSCDQISGIIPVLNYTNGLSGSCERSGDTGGVQSGTFDECGGIISYTWSDVDQCGHPLNYSQVITVEPAAPPVYLEMPEDITLDCEEEVPAPQELPYSNSSASVTCLIEGTSIADVQQNGLVTTYTWTYETECNPSATITYSQNITESVIPEISIDPTSTTICAGEEFDLSTISVTNATGTIALIEYQDDFGNLLPSSIVQPNETTDYIIAIFNDDICSDMATFTVNVEQGAETGIGLLGNLCAGEESINLFSYLGSPFDYNGTWFDVSGSGVNINNPEDVNLSQLATGIYQFSYEIIPGNVCPPSISTITLEIFEAASGEVLEAECDDTNTTYSVYLLNVNGDVTTDITSSTVTTFNDGSVTVSDIPIESNITITFIDGLGCSSELTLEPPVCDCPTVPIPTAVMSSPVCVGDPIVNLSVTVELGLTANWYDASFGGTLLESNSLTYTPSVSSAGVYTYYVQSVDQNGCLSSTRTPVTLEIIEAPTAMDAILSDCVNEDGEWSLDLSTINSFINTNNSFTYKYYNSLSDAENNNDEISPQMIDVTADLILFVSVINPQGCIAYAEVMLSPLPLPTFGITTFDEQCLGNNNGEISINNISPPNTMFAINSIDYTDTTAYDNLSAGQYIIYAQSLEGCESNDTASILSGVDITLENIVVICSNNETLTNPNDDTYTISFTVSGTDPANIVVTDNNNGVVPAILGDTISFTIDADPNISDAVYTITDSASGCSTSLNTGSLNPCSTDCSFDLSPLEPMCMGNGSPTNPADDFYTVEIFATAGNNTATSYIVLVDGVVITLFNYGAGGQITLPAEGQTSTITIQDSDDEQCFLSETFSNLDPCSDQCIMDILDLSDNCNNNETGEIESDDIITVSFTINPTNAPGTAANVYVDGILDGEYSYGSQVTLVMMAMSNTMATIRIEDNVDSTCEYSFDQDLNPCSSCEGDVEAGPDGILTCSVTSLPLVGMTNPPAMTTYWTTPSSQLIDGDTLTANSIGTYYYSADYGDNCIIIDSLEISTDDSVPTAAATPDLIFDCDTDSLEIVGLATGGTGPFSYSWYDQNGNLIGSNISIIIYAPGFYELEIYDNATGCSSPRESVLVEDRISGPAAIIYTDPSDALDCIIEVVYLSSDEETGTLYKWTINGIETPIDQLSITDSAEIMLIAIDSITGCENTDSLSIPSLIEYPFININPVESLDCDTDMVTIDASGSQLGDNISITWFDDNGSVIAQNQSTIEAISVGAYILQLVDSENGCENSDTTYVIDVGDRPQIELESMVMIPCDQIELDLTVNIITTLTDFTVSWTAIGGNIINGQSSTTATVDGPGDYEVTVFNNENGCDQVAQVSVSYPEQISDLSLDLEDQSCDEILDGSATIAINTGGSPPFTYYLDGTVVNLADLDQLSSGTYDLLIIDNNNCEFDTSFTIDVLPPFDLSLPPDITVTEGQLSTFSIETSLDPSEIGSILWNPSSGLNCDTCATVIFSGQTSEDYTVTVSDLNGCTAEASIRLSLDPVYTIYFPNIINPDGTDNTFFYPITNDPNAIVNELLIYDRWGNLMFVNKNFQPNTPELGWDGSYKRQKAVLGVYVFYSKLTYGDGTTEAISGDVTLSR